MYYLTSSYALRGVMLDYLRRHMYIKSIANALYFYLQSTSSASISHKPFLFFHHCPISWRSSHKNPSPYMIPIMLNDPRVSNSGALILKIAHHAAPSMKPLMTLKDISIPSFAIFFLPAVLLIRSTIILATRVIAPVTTNIRVPHTSLPTLFTIPHAKLSNIPGKNLDAPIYDK